MARSSRYAPSPQPERSRRRTEDHPRRQVRDYDPKAATKVVWLGRPRKAPTEPVSPVTKALRRAWYAQNPWRPDWDANWNALKGARACMLERGSA